MTNSAQKYNHPIYRVFRYFSGVTVHSVCVESFKTNLQRYEGERWVVVDCEKKTFFLNTLYHWQTVEQRDYETLCYQWDPRWKSRCSCWWSARWGRQWPTWAGTRPCGGAYSRSRLNRVIQWRRKLLQQSQMSVNRVIAALRLSPITNRCTKCYRNRSRLSRAIKALNHTNIWI